MVFHHYGVPVGLSPTLHTFAEAGYCGVTFFFVLSGFVLAHVHGADFRDGIRPAALRAYAVARVARVYPLYAFVLLAPLAPELLAGRELPRLWEHVLALQAWDPNLEVAFAYNSPGWSLSVEFFLYACFPWLALALARVDRDARSLVLALGVVAGALGLATLWFELGPSRGLPWEDPASAHRWLYRSPVSRLGDFALGMLAARLRVHLAARPGAARLALPLAAAGAAASAALMLWPRHLYSASSFDWSYALPAVAIVLGLALAGDARAPRWLTSRALVRLGEVSYAVYLVQMPLLEALGSLPAPATAPARYAADTALVLAALGAVAFALHYAVERPARRALRALAGAPPPG